MLGGAVLELSLLFHLLLQERRLSHADAVQTASDPNFKELHKSLPTKDYQAAAGCLQ